MCCCSFDGLGVISSLPCVAFLVSGCARQSSCLVARDRQTSCVCPIMVLLCGMYRVCQALCQCPDANRRQSALACSFPVMYQASSKLRLSKACKNLLCSAGLTISYRACTALAGPAVDLGCVAIEVPRSCKKSTPFSYTLPQCLASAAEIAIKVA